MVQPQQAARERRRHRAAAVLGEAGLPRHRPVPERAEGREDVELDRARQAAQHVGGQRRHHLRREGRRDARREPARGRVRARLCACAYAFVGVFVGVRGRAWAGVGVLGRGRGRARLAREARWLTCVIRRYHPVNFITLSAVPQSTGAGPTSAAVPGGVAAEDTGSASAAAASTSFAIDVDVILVALASMAAKNDAAVA